jgi:hypothetical protein
MKKKLVCLLAAGVIALGGNAALAQEKNPDEQKGKEQKIEEQKTGDQKDDKKILEVIKEIYRRLDIGVQIFMDWTEKWGQKDSGSGAPYGNTAGTGAGTGAFDRVVKGGNGATSATNFQPSGQDYRTKNNNGFNITRAYLNVIYKINDILTARLTTDADAGVSGSADANPAFHIFLKFAYIEAKKDFGPVWLSASGGMIGTLVIPLIDKVSDYRWIQPNYLNQSKIVLSGSGNTSRSFDNAADLGAKVSFGVMKYLTLSGMFSNGSGFTANETNSFKAISYLAIVNPTKEIYIFGMGRNDILAKLDYTGKKTKKEYYGYGVAYMGDIIKIGFYHLFPYETTVGLTQTNLSLGGNTIIAYPVKRTGFMLLDSWFNFSLGAIVKEAPLLVTGRFVYGFHRGTYQRYITDTELGKSRNSMIYALGLGWAFVKNFRIMIGGEIQKYFVKKNRLLTSQEPLTASPNYYNASALGAGQFYVGSRNPHDTKRLYIKAEVVF